MLGEERMKVIEYKNLEWYIINETDKEKLLFLRDSFTNEQILKYFTDRSMIDSDYDVIYSRLNNPWFIDSYIRKVLNVGFLNDLDKNDLNIMKTTLTLKDKTRVSEDYVRLITKEEVERLPKEILKTERRFGYWTMTPSNIIGYNAFEFYVKGSNNSGNLGSFFVKSTYSVRPVISLKSNGLIYDQKLETAEQVMDELIKMIYILKNNKINETTWLRYFSEYNSLKDIEGPIAFKVLINLLGTSLINANLSTINLNDLNGYNEHIKSIEESLGHSKKLMIN